MPLVISGKLSLPVTGQPASNAEVRFRAVNSAGEIIQGAESTARCDASGNYSISIEFARYELATKISTVDFVVHGQVTIDADITASDLEDLISLISVASELTDDLLKQFAQLKVEAESAASEAKDDAKIASDAEAAVTPMYNYFNENYPTFESGYNDFEIKYPDVVAKHGEIVTLAAQASDDADKSHDWAVGPSGNGDIATNTNNSWYWAEQAKYNANQTFISGGLFTPTSGSPYPPTSGVVRDTIWLVEFASHSTTFTYTSGDLNGITVTNGDMLFYDTPSNKFNHIPTNISGVLSVNGQNGPNVNIDAYDVGALPADGKAADSSNLNGRSDYYSPDNKPTADDVGAIPDAPVYNKPLITKTADYASDTALTDLSKAGFFRANGVPLDGKSLPYLMMHIPHSVAANGKANFGAGIGFSYGGSSAYVTKFNSEGVYQGMDQIYTTGYKPTAADVGAAPDSLVNRVEALEDRANQNLLVNGDCSVNQKGLTVVTASGNFIADMAKAFILGGTVRFEYLDQDITKINVKGINVTNADTNAIGLTLGVEWRNGLYGSDLTLSLDVEVGTPKDIGTYIIINDGSVSSIPAYDINSKYVTTPIKPSASGRYSTLLKMPTYAEIKAALPNFDIKKAYFVVGVWSSLGNNYKDRIGGTAIDGSGADYIITNFKLELGSIATAFVHDDPATNIAKCQRYGQLLSVSNLPYIDLRPSMRATPVVTPVTGGYWYGAEL